MNRHFVRHYVEKVIAMLLGMAVLGGAGAALLGAVGVDVGGWREDAPELLLLAMATTMTAPMIAWMRYRGHGWAPAWEMAGSMFAPTFAAIALLWAGAVEDTHSLLMIQHIAMFPLMLLVMLPRREEYSRHHASPPVVSLAA